MLQYQEIISKMTLEEKASMMSGQDTWRTKDYKKMGIPAMFLSRGKVELSMTVQNAGGGRRSSGTQCFPAGNLFPDSSDYGEQLGYIAWRKTGRMSGRGGSNSWCEHGTWTGTEHEAKPPLWT